MRSSVSKGQPRDASELEHMSNAITSNARPEVEADVAKLSGTAGEGR
jgi:hypothetical protein